MKKHCLLFALAFLCIAQSSFAQMVGATAFMQGGWLQGALAPNGSWGNSANPPGGYFTRGGAFPSYTDPILGTTATNAIDFSYDQGHDGFAVGIIPWYGSYFLPGTPYNGWQFQFNGVMGNANYTSSWMGGYDTSLGCNWHGVTSYRYPDCVNPKRPATGIWDGFYGIPSQNLRDAIHIIAVNEIDTLASWMNVTIKMYNTTDSTLRDVYYMASADPDNDVPIGGGFATDNHIAYQGGGLDRHEVWARPNNGTPKINQDCFTGLATQDCRGEVLIYQSWPPGMVAGNTLDKVYNQTTTSMGTCWYPLGSTTAGQDIAYALVFNVGNIPPHDSAYVHFAWIFSDTNAIDSIYRLQPQLSTEGKQYYSYQKDSVLACEMSGCEVYGDTMFQAHIINGENRDWALSTWTWAPALGLSTTVGRDVLVDIRKLTGPITYTITGIPAAAPRGTCLPTAPQRFTLYVQPCFLAFDNDPCEGDSLKFGMSGDSVGATYQWYGPKGFTSTLHRAFKYPATLTDTGYYFVIKTIGTLHDTDSTYVVIHPKPSIKATNNSPLCNNKRDTLELHALPGQPGMTYQWTGPNTFTSPLQHPFVYDFKPVDTGFYKVIVATTFGCKDTDSVYARQIPPPPPPIISGDTSYCQNEAFRGFTATTTPPGSPGTILWYTVSTGGISSTTPPVFLTTSPGIQTVYATVLSAAGCESDRTPYSIRIKPTPPAPVTTGGVLQYCQYIGPFVPVTVNTVSGATYQWYTVATGGTPQSTQPSVDLTMVGTVNSYVSQTLNGCEGPRALVAVIVNPKPAPPTPLVQKYCQFETAVAVSATPSIPGDRLRWYHGALDAVGTLTPFIPITTIPGLDTFFVNETSAFGCISEKAIDTVRTNPKPAPPIPRDTTFCQWTINGPLFADSAFGSHLKWYDGSTPLTMAPVPHNTKVGDSIFYVTQIVLGCESDPAPIKVTTVYKPVFSIQASSPFVCQFDSVRFAYLGPKLFHPEYIWGIPAGASYARGKSEGSVSIPVDSMIYVRFDSVTQDNYIRLHVSNNDGFCFGDTSFRIKIVPQPLGRATTKADVCQGDTLILAIGSKSASASDFLWEVDNVPLDKTTTLNILAHNNNSGGPFSISWNDVGRHVIQVSSFTEEGCKSLPTEDTVHVHVKPDATFTYLTRNGTLCLEDSVLFTARNDDYRNSYMWTPEHYFANDNKRSIYGKVEENQSYITLRVTDPFGCYATTSQLIEPASCCTVSFPTAFTPNGDNKNDFFRPIYVGFHRFHEFRIVNRWGQTVFESVNSNMRWDGTYNAVPQDMGVYFYYIKYDCGGKTIEQNGDVTLIR